MCFPTLFVKVLRSYIQIQQANPDEARIRFFCRGEFNPKAIRNSAIFLVICAREKAQAG